MNENKKELLESERAVYDILQSCGRWYKNLYLRDDILDTFGDDTHATFIAKIQGGETYTIKKVNTKNKKGVQNQRFYINTFDRLPYSGLRGLGLSHTEDDRQEWVFTTPPQARYICLYLGYHSTPNLKDYQCIVRDVQLLSDTNDACSNPELPQGGEQVKQVGGPYPECDEEGEPQLPTPEGGGTNDSSCSNTGQFGGGGTPLKDIKLFLYANNVTKGTIKLNKPQVEVGAYATDWRPNPADVTKSIEMMLKQIESVRKGGKKSGKKRD